MTLEVLFWFLMIIWLLFGMYLNYEAGKPYPFVRGAGTLLVFVLLAILGWQVFGAPIKH